jgi:uncharacterized protein YcgI (DUF1989 family)
MVRIPPQSGVAFHLKRGQVLRVIDPEGEQVSDLVAFADGDASERFAAGYTTDYANSIFLTTGGVLYSNRSRPMFTIVADDVGRHDLLLSPCSEEMFRILRGVDGHPSCDENIRKSLASQGLQWDGTDAFNIFMNVNVAPDGAVSVDAPLSKAGDHIDLRAEMDLVVALTACSSEHTNNGRCKPIEYEVLDFSD